MFCVLPALVVAALAFVEPASAPANYARPVLLRSAQELLEAPDRRVRAATGPIKQLLREGLRRSHTFRSVMAAVDRTDLIVYVEFHQGLPTGVTGRLLIVPSTGYQRYVRIQLASGGPPYAQIATLAHELQHAVEVGEAPEVRDASGLQQLYLRIGIASLEPDAYDTFAAQRTGRRVLAELAG